MCLLRSGGFEAALTASNRAAAALEYAVSVAYVPSARTRGWPLPLAVFSGSSSPPASSKSRWERDHRSGQYEAQPTKAPNTRTCSEARIGTSPSTLRISWKASWISKQNPVNQKKLHISVGLGRVAYLVPRYSTPQQSTVHRGRPCLI